jgi:hypothetical protein
MPTRADLQALVDRGFALVPVRRGSKAPDTPDWVHRTFEIDDFEPDDNVGVKLGDPSNGLVDVDCDSDLMAQAARELLPHTLSHCRPSRPHSHYWFRVIDPKTGAWATPDGTRRYTGLTGGNLAELRGAKAQTVVPPSVHPSGEVLAWVDPHRPVMALTLDEIEGPFRSAMIAAVLAEHWPAANRHAFSGHLGGFLAKYIEPNIIERLVRVAARLAKDEEPDDRARFARESGDKMRGGAKVTGAPKVREAMGEAGQAFVSFVRKLYGADEGIDQFEAMNAKHFVVQMGAKMAVGEEPTRPGEAVVYQTFEEFTKKYCNQFVGKQNLATAWLKWPERRTYSRMVFAPPASDVYVAEDDYNIWQGFVCEPLDTNPLPYIERYLEHLHRVVANDSEGVANYVVDLLADCVQRPGDPPGKALVLRGPQGRGKSLPIDAFGALFGRHYMSVNHRSQLTGAFNSHLSGRVVVHGDDAVWGGNKDDIGVLKFLTTQRMLPITRKHLDTVPEPNFIHLFLSTNEKWAWPAGNNERRGVVLDVTAQRPREYFDALVAEIRHPSFKPALLAYLLARTIDRRALLDGITNAALREQQDMSVSVEQQWWRMILEDGYWKGEPWPEFITLDHLYDQFTIDMGSQRGAGVSHRGTRMNLTRRLLEMLPRSTRVSTRKLRENLHDGVRGLMPEYVEKVRKVIVLPPLSACRHAYDVYAGTSGVWPEVEVETQMELEEL